ncbi:MAG TPA: hypothetical protein VK451_06175 [Methyloceanibacter sp.]|nr:hypothetical protein [Methyloceanibacter sp.]
MTSFNTPAKLSREILVLTAGIFLLAATPDALAKNGHSGDHGDMSSGKHKDKNGEMYSEKHKDKSGEMYSQNGVKRSDKHKDKGQDGAKYSEKHKDKGKSKEYAEKAKDKDKHKTSGSSTASNNPPAPGTGGTNTIHPIPSPAPVASSSGALGDVPPPVNTIHPIQSPTPVASSSGGPVTTPVNTIVRDHRHPAGTGPNGEGGATGQQYQGADPGKFQGFGGQVLDGIADFGYGLTHGFAPGPAPEDPTGTYSQY